MHALRVPLGDRSYPVLVGRGLLGQPELLGTLLAGHQVLVVTNEVVGPLWLKPVRAALEGFEFGVQVLPDGEEYKTLETLGTVFDTLAEHRFNRDATIVALGGGVVGDLAGFAAACWQRGVDFIQLPTTLLAQVDAAIGGKTAVNIPAGKNLVGAFHQPRAVIADISTLATLPRKEFCAGLGEVIKYGLGLDADLFEWVETNTAALMDRDPEALERVVHWCCVLKAGIVAADEREAGERALLNLGHTFAHAIEAAVAFGNWLHGEAVAVGLVMASRLAVRLGMVDEALAGRVEALVAALGLPITPPPVGATRLRTVMALDKKIAGGRLRFVLPTGIGTSALRADVPETELDAVLAMAEPR
jgi:3-dehydroquinate synthase